MRSSPHGKNNRSFLLHVDPNIFWAKERTFLAWIRTGLALMGFGFVVAKFNLFLRMVQAQDNKMTIIHSGWAMWFGTILVLFGVLVQILAVVDYRQFIDHLKRKEKPYLKTSYLGLSIATGLGLMGLVMAVYLLVTN